MLKLVQFSFFFDSVGFIIHFLTPFLYMLKYKLTLLQQEFN